MHYLVFYSSTSGKMTLSAQEIITVEDHLWTRELVTQKLLIGRKTCVIRSKHTRQQFYNIQSKLLVVFKWWTSAQHCDWLTSLLTTPRKVSIWRSAEQAFCIRRRRFAVVLSLQFHWSKRYNNKQATHFEMKRAKNERQATQTASFKLSLNEHMWRLFNSPLGVKLETFLRPSAGVRRGCSTPRLVACAICCFLHGGSAGCRG